MLTLFIFQYKLTNAKFNYYINIDVYKLSLNISELCKDSVLQD